MKLHGWILALGGMAVTLWAEPSKDVKTFEADTDTLSQQEILQYMGRGPDARLTPHLWRYRGAWTNAQTMETFNTVDLAFGMLTDSHKYGVMSYNWDNTTPTADGMP